MQWDTNIYAIANGTKEVLLLTRHRIHNVQTKLKLTLYMYWVNSNCVLWSSNSISQSCNHGAAAAADAIKSSSWSKHNQGAAAEVRGASEYRYLWLFAVVNSRKREMASLVPRPSTTPVFDCLQYAKMEGGGLGNFITWSRQLEGPLKLHYLGSYP